MSIKKDIQTKGFHSEQEKAFVNLIHTAAHFESLFTHFIKDFGLSPQQYNVLRILRGQSPNAILGVNCKRECFTTCLTLLVWLINSLKKVWLIVRKIAMIKDKSLFQLINKDLSS